MKHIKILSMVLMAALISAAGRAPVSARQAQVDEMVCDEDISVTSFEEMGYPLHGLLMNVQGDVVVRVKLDRHGKVIYTTAISGSRALMNDALDNARKWQFRPNTDNTAVIIYEFRFPKGTCGPALNQLFIFRAPNIASVTACPTHSQPTSN